MATSTIKVIGMTCGHCTQAAEEALTAVPGVESAQADLEAGTAIVQHDGSVSEDTLKGAVEAIGFDVE